mmetsp:Transcript_67753/g.107354  ORF Transcript_67753/g.107354 Transcript_67753/m.107354 type:complete len:150 (+) Transcript_67753:76-525(+)
MGTAPNKCCCAEDVKGSQLDSVDAGTVMATAPTSEELVKPKLAPETEPAEKLNQGSKSGRPLREWTVILKKTPEESRLGLAVDIANGTYLVVDKVDGGLMGNWNRDHPDKEVLEGDVIVSVNGIVDEAVKLTHVCKSSQVLELKFQRET